MKIVIFARKITDQIIHLVSNNQDVIYFNSNVESVKDLKTDVIYIFVDPNAELEQECICNRIRIIKLYLQNNYYDLSKIIQVNINAYYQFQRFNVFSVIITCYNNHHLLANTLESLRKQVFVLFDVILVDDGSNKPICKCILDEYSDLPIKVIEKYENRGTYVCRNVGIRNSTANYVCTLDAGDAFVHDKLMDEIHVFMEDEHIQVINSKYLRSGIEKFGNSILTINKQFITDCMGYYHEVRYGADSEFVHRLYMNHENAICRLNKVTYYYLQHENALTTIYPEEFRLKYRIEFEKMTDFNKMKIHFTQSPHVKPYDVEQNFFQIASKKFGILQIANISKGLFRDGVIFNHVLNNNGVRPYVFYYSDWKKIQNIDSQVQNAESKYINNALRGNNIIMPRDNYEYKTIKQFVNNVDLIIIMEVGLFGLIRDILALGKKVIFMVNPDCAISLNKMNVEEYVEELRELTKNPDFRVLSRTNVTKQIMLDNGIESTYVPFTVNDEIKTIPSVKAKNDLVFLMNVGTCGAENRKCVDQCVNVFKRVCLADPNIKFIVKSVIDVGKFGAVVEEEFKDRIELINEQYNVKQMRNLKMGADAVVYISKYDGLGLSVLETMHKHKPIIINHAQIYDELLHAYDKVTFVNSRVNGKWRLADVEEIDFDDLYEKILKVAKELRDPAINRKQFSNETTHYRKKLFDIAFAKMIQSMFYDVKNDEARVIGHMATFQKRENTLFDTMLHVLPQVQYLKVGMNDYESKHCRLFKNLEFCSMKRMDKDYRAMTKFILIEESLSNGPAYIFTFDDDLDYPRNYVTKYIRKLQKYNNSCVISLCGRLYNSYPKTRFDAVSYGFREERQEDHFVHNVGTGVQAFHSNILKDFSVFLKDKNNDLMQYSCDEYWAKYLLERNIFCICIDNFNKMWVKINHNMKEGLHEIKLKNPDLSDRIVRDVLQIEWPNYDEQFLI